MPSNEWEEKLENAVQTALPNISAILSYCKEDESWAEAIQEAFPQIGFRLETTVPKEEETNSTKHTDFLFCILTPQYAALPPFAVVRASAFASQEKLVIFQCMPTDEVISHCSEEWQSLTLDREWSFSAFDNFSLAMKNAELFLLKSTTEEDYSAVVQIDDYLVIKELGFGQQGVVYQAQHVVTKQLVAIKEIRNVKGGTVLSESAKLEIAIMKKLNHENVTKLFAAYVLKENLYLVLEYVDGGSFASDESVWNGTARTLSNISQVQHIFQQLVRGLSYLHHMGVLHRDIKPSNLLMASNGVVKYADFGVSSLINRGKSLRVLGEDDILYVASSGTPAFLPPEACGASLDLVYNGRGGDVWSLGVTFYVLLMGRLPFRGNDRNETAHLICTQQKISFPKAKFPSSSVLHQQCKHLIKSMLVKDPNKRITLPAVCSHEFIQIVNWKEELPSGRIVHQLNSSEISNSVSLPTMFTQEMRRKSSSLKRSFVKLKNSLPMLSMQSNSNRNEEEDNDDNNEDVNREDSLLLPPSPFPLFVVHGRPLTLWEEIQFFFETWCCCGIRKTKVE